MPAGPSTVRRRPGLRRTAAARGRSAFAHGVARASDPWLESTLGTGPGLRLLFRTLEEAFVPARARGLMADVQCDLRTADGRLRPWTVHITPARADARPGRATAPRLTVGLTVADLVRIAAGELDPGDAVLTGRLDLRGDFPLAMRLGELFGAA